MRNVFQFPFLIFFTTLGLNILQQFCHFPFPNNNASAEGNYSRKNKHQKYHIRYNSAPSLSGHESLNINPVLYTFPIYCHPSDTTANCGEQTVAQHWCLMASVLHFLCLFYLSLWRIFRLRESILHTFSLNILGTLGILRHIEDSINLFPFLTVYNTTNLIFPLKQCTIIDETTSIRKLICKTCPLFCSEQWLGSSDSVNKWSS